MKKLFSTILCLALLLNCAALLSACGSNNAASAAPSAPSVTEVGTWELTDIAYRTIEQGKLTTANHSTLTIFSDNTYIITAVMDTHYSSDGGETFNPVNYLATVAYGKYEVTGEDKELNEKTVKFTSVDRIVKGDYDTATAGNDGDKEIMNASEIIGSEVILGADHKLSEMLSVTNFMNVGGSNNPYEN